jgi:hypothetical protein
MSAVETKLSKALSKDIKYLLYSAGSCKNLRGIHPVVRSKLNFNEALIFQMVYTKAVKRKVLDKRYKKIADLKLRKTITREYLESVMGEDSKYMTNLKAVDRKITKETKVN